MERNPRNKNRKERRRRHPAENPELANLEFADENEFVDENDFTDLERHTERRYVRKKMKK